MPNPFPLVGYPVIAPDAASARTALGLGSAATQASTAFDSAGAAAAAQAASQPLDSDLTALAALSTTSFGRSLLALADAAALLTALNPNRCRVFNSGSQPISNATVTALTFDSERYDSNNLHSTSSNTSRLVAPSAGEYRIGGQVAFAANGTGGRQVGIRVNGTTTIVYDVRYVSSASGRMYLPISTEYHLAAADYVELIVFQDSTASLNSVVDGNDAPEFWMSQVA